MKLNLSNVIIEITRKCNMECAHCLRGDAQNMDIDTKHIDSLLSQVDNINELTFTGGEPSLNVEAIRYTIEEIKKRDIGIGSFYIATNGLTIKSDFLLACLELYAMAEYKDGCAVDVSNDIFHNAEGCYDMELLQGLSFVKKKFHTDEYDYNKFSTILGEGRGANYSINETEYPEHETQEEIMMNMLYLNCQGNMLLDCDLSYETQEMKEAIFCKVEDLTSTIETYEEC